MHVRVVPVVLALSFFPASARPAVARGKVPQQNQQQTRPAPGSQQGRPQRPGNQGSGSRPGSGAPPNQGGGRPTPGPGNGKPPGQGGNRPNPGSGGNRPNPGQGGNRPNPGSGGGSRPQPNRPQPPRPGRPGSRPPHSGRPPNWGRPPQNRPSFHFRPNDRAYLRRHYLSHLAYINLARRPVFVAGGFFPYGDIGYLAPVPASLYGYLPPVPPGYSMGYFDGYVVVYDPLTYFIADVIDLMQQ